MKGRSYKIPCHVQANITLSHESKITVVLCVTVAHLVGELSCDDAILDEQHKCVVCDDSHQEEKHNPREKPSLLQS